MSASSSNACPAWEWGDSMGPVSDWYMLTSASDGNCFFSSLALLRAMTHILTAIDVRSTMTGKAQDGILPNPAILQHSQRDTRNDALQLRQQIYGFWEHKLESDRSDTMKVPSAWKCNHIYSTKAIDVFKFLVHDNSVSTKEGALKYVKSKLRDTQYVEPEAAYAYAAMHRNIRVIVVSPGNGAPAPTAPRASKALTAPRRPTSPSIHFGAAPGASGAARVTASASGASGASGATSGAGRVTAAASGAGAAAASGAAGATAAPRQRSPERSVQPFQPRMRTESLPPPMELHRKPLLLPSRQAFRALIAREEKAHREAIIRQRKEAADKGTPRSDSSHKDFVVLGGRFQARSASSNSGRSASRRGDRSSSRRRDRSPSRRGNGKHDGRKSPRRRSGSLGVQRIAGLDRNQNQNDTLAGGHKQSKFDLEKYEEKARLRAGVVFFEPSGISFDCEVEAAAQEAAAVRNARSRTKYTEDDNGVLVLDESDESEDEEEEEIKSTSKSRIASSIARSGAAAAQALRQQCDWCFVVMHIHNHWVPLVSKEAVDRVKAAYQDDGAGHVPFNSDNLKTLADYLVAIQLSFHQNSS